MYVKFHKVAVYWASPLHWNKGLKAAPIISLSASSLDSHPHHKGGIIIHTATQQNRWIWTRIEIEKVSFVITKPYTHIIYSTIRIHSNRLRSKYTWNFEILPWAKPLRQPTTDIALCESLINPRYLPFSFDPLRIYVSINENLIKFFSVLRALINTNCVIFYERNQQ